MCIRVALRRPERVLAFALGCALVAFFSLGCLLLSESPVPTADESLTAGSLAANFSLRRALRSPAIAALRRGDDRTRSAERAADLAMNGKGNNGTSDSLVAMLGTLESKMEELERKAERVTGEAAIASRPVSVNAAQHQADTSQQQVAALSLQVASVLSLLVSGRSGAGAAVASTPLPPPPLPPVRTTTPFKFESIEKQIRFEAKRAADTEAATAAAAASTEIAELKKKLEKAVNQDNDRYAHVLSQLPSPDPPTSNGSDFVAAEQQAGHGCRVPPCSRDLETCKLNRNCCSDLMFEMLMEFSKFLTERDIVHFVVAGTLIGAFRDNDIIPTTSDIDVLIPREGWDKVREINSDRNRTKGYYFMQDPEERHCARLCAAWQGLPVNKASFTKHFDWDNERLGSDVPYYMDIYDEHMDIGERFSHLMYPPSTVTIRNVSFPAPRDAELWIEAKYGPTWRTPDHVSHGGQGHYPTLSEGQAWSKGMVLLRSGRTDATVGHRLLERATVNHQTGNIVVQGGATAAWLTVKAKEFLLEGFETSTVRNATSGEDDVIISGGMAVVTPPDEHECDITHYKFYWGAERLKGWDLALEKLGNGPLLAVPRCGGDDPFQACSTYGVKLRAELPANEVVPPGATHLVVVVANEAGEANDAEDVPLYGGASHDSKEIRYSRLIQLGLLSGYDASVEGVPQCMDGRGPPIVKDGLVEATDTMLQRTPASMKKGLAMMADWVSSVCEVLSDCSSSAAAPLLAKSLAAALQHLREPEEFEYSPGEMLRLDGKSLINGVNAVITRLREDNTGAVGAAIGEILRLFAPGKPGAPPEDLEDALDEEFDRLEAQAIKDRAADEPDLEDAPSGDADTPAEQAEPVAVMTFGSRVQDYSEDEDTEASTMEETSEDEGTSAESDET